MPIEVGSSVSNKKTFLAAVMAMIAGITKDFTARMSLMVGGTSMTQAAILAKLGSIEQLWEQITTTKNAYTAAVKAKDAQSQDAKQFMADLKKAVEVQFGSKSPQLLDFGIALPKPKAARTSAQKAASAGVATQTRKVRGTMSKKAKEQITVSGVPGVVVVGPDGLPLQGVTKGGPIAPVPVPENGSSTPVLSQAPGRNLPVASAAPAGSTPAAAGNGGTSAGGSSAG